MTERARQIGMAAVLVCLALSAADAKAYRKPGPNKPDQKVDLFGEFLWARAVGDMEDLAVVGPPTTDDPWGGKAKDDRSHLLFTFERGGALKRSNLTSISSDIAHTVQFKRLWLETTGAHNSKTMLGYMPTNWRFTHGDNGDLVHWAPAPRVVLFIPVRHAQGADPDNPANYFISPYGGQTISVMEFKPGELVRYEWFRGGPDKLDRHVLFDLYPHCGGERDLKPGLHEPIFKFEVGPKGAWKVSIERDGRDGLAGGENDGDYDLVFTHESEGARPFTVDLGAKPHFGMSVYCPSGSPNHGARMLYKVEAFDRETGKVLEEQPARTRHVRDVALSDLPERLALKEMPRLTPAMIDKLRRALRTRAQAIDGDSDSLRTVVVTVDQSRSMDVPDSAPPVKVMDRNGKVVLNNGLIEVHVEPARGMYVTRAVDLTTNQTIVTDLKLNFPYFEHGIKRNQSAGYRVIKENDGSVTLAMNMRFSHHKGANEVKRYGRFGERILSEMVTIRPNSALLEFRGRVDNPTPLRMSSRLWDRALMPVDEHTHFIMPASHGVEHSANWIKPWPRWEVTLKDGTKQMRDFTLARNWKLAGVRLPTQYFALNQIWPFSGVYHEKTDINRIRIHQPPLYPGVKMYYGGAFELWGGTTPIFEDPGHFLDGYTPIDYEQAFYIASGIGKISFANRSVAMHVETGEKPVVRVTASRKTPDARVVVGLPSVRNIPVYESAREEHGPPLMRFSGTEKRLVILPLAEKRGDIGPGQSLTIGLDKAQDAFVVAVYDGNGILKAGDHYWASRGVPERLNQSIRAADLAGVAPLPPDNRSSCGVIFPITIPDTGDDYEAAKQACSRKRAHWVELQEHANHTGIENALAASGHAKRLLKAEKPEVERMVSLANACYRIGDFAHATALARRVLEADAKNQHAHHVLGMVAYEQGSDRETILDHLKQAGGQAYYVRALMYVEREELDEAVKILRAMFNEFGHSNVYRPRMLLATLLARLGKAGEASELAKLLAQQNPASPEAQETLYRVATQNGDEELAAYAAGERDKLLRNNPDAARQMGLFRQELDAGRWVYPARYRFELPTATR